MDVNKVCIFGTRPRTIFGEVRVSKGPALSAQGFNEGKVKAFTTNDIQFATKGNIRYVIILNGSGIVDININDLAKKSPLLDGCKISKLSLLGSNKEEK